MAASVLRIATSQPVLLSGTLLATAVAASVQKRCGSHALRKKPEHRFTGQVVVYGRNAQTQIRKCVEKLLEAEVVGVSFDYDTKGRITVVKLATPSTAILCPVSDSVGLDDDVLSLLKSRCLLKVVYDGFDDVAQLENRFGVKMEHFSDVYLDAAQLKKPDFPTVAELAQHCCEITLDKPPLLGACVDYRLKSVGLPEIVKAVMQSWALTVLHARLAEESPAAHHRLPVYSSPAQYFTDAALLSRVRRSAAGFATPVQQIGDALAREPLQYRENDGGRRDGGGGRGGGGGSAGARQSPSPVSPHSGWLNLPLDNDALLRLALWRLRQQRLSVGDSTTSRRSENESSVTWSPHRACSSSVFCLPGVAIAFSTESMFGGVERAPPLSAGVATTSPGSGADGMGAGDGAQSWQAFVKQEVGRIKTKMSDFLAVRDVLSMTQASCHGSVSVLSDAGHLLRVNSDAQSLQALRQSCMAPAPMTSPLSAMTSLSLPQPRTLHALVTDLQVASRLPRQNCMAPAHVPSIELMMGQLPELKCRLEPCFRMPELKTVGVPVVDLACVHAHFRRHYADASVMLAAGATAACEPVRVMASSTSVFAVRR